MQLYETVSDVKKYIEAEKKYPNLEHYIGRGEKMFFTDAQEYIKELRNCDRCS